MEDKEMTLLDEFKEDFHYYGDHIKLNLILSNKHLFKYIIENLDKLHRSKDSDVEKMKDLEGLFDYIKNKDFKSFFSNKHIIFNKAITDYLIDECGLTYEVFLENLKYSEDLNNIKDLKNSFMKRGHIILKYLDDSVTYDPNISFKEFEYFVKKTERYSLPYDVIYEYLKRGHFVNTLFNNDENFLVFITEYKDVLNDDFFNNQIVINTISKLIKYYYREILLIFKNRSLDNYSDEFKKLIAYGFDIANSTGKINTLEDNENLNYSLVKYIYPLLGKDMCIELLKYKTDAIYNMTFLITRNYSNELVKIIDLINKYHLCSNSVSPISFIFDNFNFYRNLFIDIVRINPNLNKDDLDNLNSVIRNNNYYNINNLNDLYNYKNIVLNKTKDIYNNGTKINKLNYFYVLFGFSDYNDLVLFTKSYNYNFMTYSKILNDLRKRNIDVNDLLLTKEDIVLLKLLNKFKECKENNSEDNIVNDILKYIIDNNKNLDLTNWKEDFINKNRKLYNRHLQCNLTDPNSIKGKRYNENGVTIIEYESGEFNYLAHCLYNFDYNVNGFDTKLKNDPSLWTKLEGVSTVSTSFISDKSFNLLTREDYYDVTATIREVIYLFSDIPDNFLLYMNDCDLCTQHGRRILNPTCKTCSYTTLDGLNFRTNDERNEVSGYREGMIPTALLCLSDKPNSDTIRAAKYFSNLLGIDVPIIKMNFKKIKKDIKDGLNNLSYKYMKDDPPLLTEFDMLELIHRSKSYNIEITNNLILKVLLSNLDSGKISIIDFYKMISILRKEIFIISKEPNKLINYINEIVNDVNNKNNSKGRIR